MAEAFSGHPSNIEELKDERGLAISASKSTIRGAEAEQENQCSLLRCTHGAVILLFQIYPCKKKLSIYFSTDIITKVLPVLIYVHNKIYRVHQDDQK